MEGSGKTRAWCSYDPRKFAVHVVNCTHFRHRMLIQVGLRLLYNLGGRKRLGQPVRQKAMRARYEQAVFSACDFC